MRVVLIAQTTIVDDIPGYVPHSNYPSLVTAADDLAEQAGRLCYLSWDRPNPGTATNKDYMRNILRQGHFSVVEHASATFYIDGITRNCTHEFVRHRHLSYSEVSQRYCDAGAFPFIEHPGLMGIGDESRHKMNAAIQVGRDAYDSIVNDLVAQGKNRKEARQAARHALVSGIETKILVTGNLRAWREMLAKRLSPAADAEFQHVAALILAELKQIAPNTFHDFE